MRKLAVAVSLLVAVGLTALVAAALADRGHGGNGGTRFSARLTGYEETPSESTPGSGTFKAKIVHGDTILSANYRDSETMTGCGNRRSAPIMHSDAAGGRRRPRPSSPDSRDR